MRVRNSTPFFAQRRAFIPYVEDENKVSKGLFYFMFAFLVFTNILTIIALFFSPDIARIIDQQNAKIFSSYEDRIAQLRIEVDRLYSRQYAQNGSLNLQIVKLRQQQEELAQIKPIILSLAKRANELGIDTKISANTSSDSNGREQNKDTDNIITGSIDSFNQNKQEQIEQLSYSISQMREKSALALNSLTQIADKSSSEIAKELANIGFVPEIPSYDVTASGGPLLINNSSQSSNLAHSANEAISALERFSASKRAIKSAPILMPLTGKYRLSSLFGKRKDPINGVGAFHSANDYAAPFGSIVRSAADGVVIFAGRRGGYGKLVEIKHANGLITRYAHLSAYLVSKGQEVEAGKPIAKVGSTGRSTGPHLHFEIRDSNKKALNPNPYLQVGKRLAQYM